MENSRIKHIIEGALLSAGTPLSAERISQLFDESHPLTVSEVKTLLQEMMNDYSDRSFELKQVASGYRFQVRSEYAPWIARLWEEKPARYTRAFLETLVIIAYRQPVTRADIEDIRGVAVSTQTMKTLQDREWIRVLGHRDVPGKPAVYGTTKEFLDYFNLKSLDELPTLSEIRDLDLVAATLDQQLELTVSLPPAEAIAEQSESLALDEHSSEQPEEVDA